MFTDYIDVFCALFGIFGYKLYYLIIYFKKATSVSMWQFWSIVVQVSDEQLKLTIHPNTSTAMKNATWYVVCWSRLQHVNAYIKD